ncbi:DNA cytosine methyltransferase [Streptomyces sp. cmx-4-9]|uniref:DNA cytosine methyltransferase n=1 Tax=Streptomyces sp. cmx-4-9 TaxID=2790941 RepID=UPI003980A7ED
MERVLSAPRTPAQPHRLGKVLSLFTGAGGLDIGLERAGLATVACLELNDDARAVLAANRPEWLMPGDGDVNTAAKYLTPAALGMKPGELDLVAGGPPCQPFSKAAQWTSSARSGMEDDRARCVHGMLDLVESFLPKAVLIENVEGFLQGKGSAAGVIHDRLRRINEQYGSSYELVAKVVDAADFGVPQHRRRAIGIAYREDVQVRLPEPTHLGSPVRAWDALWDLEEREKPVASGQWAGLLPSIPEGSNYLYLTARGDGEELFGWRTRYWSFLLKLAKDRPSWTLPASPGPSTGPFHWDNRPLSVREQMRLQTFPDDWTIDQPFRAGRRLVGNATPPLLAEVLGRIIVQDLQLGSIRARARMLKSPPTLLRERLDKLPPAVPPAAVPERYEPHIGSKDAHPGEGIGPSPRLAVVR